MTEATNGGSVTYGYTGVCLPTLLPTSLNHLVARDEYEPVRDIVATLVPDLRYVRIPDRSRLGVSPK